MAPIRRGPPPVPEQSTESWVVFVENGNNPTASNHAVSRHQTAGGGNNGGTHMTDATRPRRVLGLKLPVGIMAAALFALLAFAPFASAASDPIGSGTTTVTLNKGTLRVWKKRGVRVSKVSPAKISGTKASFTVKEGSLDPTTGAGTLSHNGGLKFKARRKSVTVKNLVIDTSKKSLSANVGGKKLKLASIVGFSFARNGFGVNLTIKKLKLTGAAAKQLNKKLGFSAKRKGHKRPRRGPFKANQVLGSGSSETQPLTVTIVPGGNVSFTPNATTLGKLAKVGVVVNTIAPTTSPKPGEFAFPISGGTISPAGTAGKTETAGGLNLVQNLGPGAETTITLGAFFFDLSAKTVSV